MRHFNNYLLLVFSSMIIVFFSCNRNPEEKNESLNQSPNKDVSIPEIPVSSEIKISNQIWMSANLDVDTFRNGDAIQEVKTLSGWLDALKNKQPAWCYYDNDSAIGRKYGRIYNWYAVNDKRGLAPSGWHIPASNEWEVLFKNLADMRPSKDDDVKLSNYGPADDLINQRRKAADMMKSHYGWFKGRNGDNSSLFYGLPGGCMDLNAHFKWAEETSYWWSSSVDSSSTNPIGFALGMLYFSDNNEGRNEEKDFNQINEAFGRTSTQSKDGIVGMYVRCIKDGSESGLPPAPTYEVKSLGTWTNQTNKKWQIAITNDGSFTMQGGYSGNLEVDKFVHNQKAFNIKWGGNVKNHKIINAFSVESEEQHVFKFFRAIGCNCEEKRDAFMKQFDAIEAALRKPGIQPDAYGRMLTKAEQKMLAVSMLNQLEVEKFNQGHYQDCAVSKHSDFFYKSDEFNVRFSDNGNTLTMTNSFGDFVFMRK